MTTSGTYTWSPNLGDVMINAFGRCQIRRPMITAEHLADAAMAANLLQADWSNMPGVNAWTVDLQSIPLVQGTATYNVDAATTMVMAAYIESGTPPRDRLIFSVGRDEYAAFPDKTSQSPPTAYWFDRLVQPTITVWQLPDGGGPYTLKFYRARQMQDASVAGGTLPEVPYRFMEAYTAALAVKLAELYAPDQMQRLAASAAASWDKAARRDTEDVVTYIVPQLGAYTRSVW